MKQRISLIAIVCGSVIAIAALGYWFAAKAHHRPTLASRAHRGDVSAMIEVQVRMLEELSAELGQDIESLIQKCRELEDDGGSDGSCDYILGIMYFSGKGVRRNYSTAIEHFQQAAASGTADAATFLGMMYYTGQGVRRNYRKATEAFNKAADQGDATARCILGDMYFAGVGVSRNYQTSAHWYRESTETIRAPARSEYMMGLMYLNGYGVAQDFMEAYVWLNLAAKSGEPEFVAARDKAASKLSYSDLMKAQEITEERAKSLTKQRWSSVRERLGLDE